MNIALHGGQYHTAFDFGRAALHGGFHFIEGCFCRFGTHEELRQEQLSGFILFSDYIKCGNEVHAYDSQGILAFAEGEPGFICRAVGQAFQHRFGEAGQDVPPVCAVSPDYFGGRCLAGTAPESCFPRRLRRCVCGAGGS